MDDAEKLRRLRESNKRLRAAAIQAREALRDNLKMYAYKNEPIMMEAFHAIEAALKRRRT